MNFLLNSTQMSRITLIDIDGTITDDVPNEELERMGTCEPYPDALEILNKWYDQGHIITFFTSRTEDHREITEFWLDETWFQIPWTTHGTNHVVATTTGLTTTW